MTIPEVIQKFRDGEKLTLAEVQRLQRRLAKIQGEALDIKEILPKCYIDGRPNPKNVEV